MLKIELVRFEAQDVITASGVVKVPAAIIHTANCANIKHHTLAEMNGGAANQIWVNGTGWVVCDCECHK